MSHVIEHLEDPMRAMAEVYRVARDGADVFVTTPHFSSHNSYIDPTHRRHLAAASFEYFTGKDFPELRGVAVPVRHREGGADVRREFRAGRNGAVAGAAVVEVVRAARGVGLPGAGYPRAVAREEVGADV